MPKARYNVAGYVGYCEVIRRYQEDDGEGGILDLVDARIEPTDDVVVEGAIGYKDGIAQFLANEVQEDTSL